MTRLARSLFLLAVFLNIPSDRFARYRPLASYETKTGIQILPVYSERGPVCEISIERRAYHDDRVSVKPTISKDEVLSLFDQLVSPVERGDPAWKLPEKTEFTEVDGGTRVRQIVNGALVVEYTGLELDEANADARRLVSSGADKALTSGYISLQSNGHPIEFRRIEVLPLDDAASGAPGEVAGH